MNRISLLLVTTQCFLFTLALVSCSQPRPAPLATTNSQSKITQPKLRPYLIEAGDTLRLDFTHHPGLNRTTIVRPDSMITVPHLGDILAGGKRPQALAQELKGRYSQVIKYPKLTVSIDSSPNQVVYVGGEVEKPGMYPITHGKTALQLILQAGGATREASLKKVYIIRDQGNQQPGFLALNLNDNLRKSHGIGDARLQAKDMLVVSKSGIATANQFVDQYLNELLPFSKSLGVTYFLGNGIE